MRWDCLRVWQGGREVEARAVFSNLTKANILKVVVVERKMIKAKVVICWPSAMTHAAILRGVPEVEAVNLRSHHQGMAQRI